MSYQQKARLQRLETILRAYHELRRVYVDAAMSAARGDDEWDMLEFVQHATRIDRYIATYGRRIEQIHVSIAEEKYDA